MSKSSFDGIGAELRELIEQAERLLSSAADENIDAVGARTRESLLRACDQMRAAERTLSRKAHAVDSAVRANPWKAIAATGLVAFLLGLIVRRR